MRKMTSGSEVRENAEEPTQMMDTKEAKKNLIQVSNQKQPFALYLRLAKRYLSHFNSVELAALGMAIPTVITISEILKRDGLAIQKDIKISAVDSTKGSDKGHMIQKAKLEIVLQRAEEPQKITISETAKHNGLAVQTDIRTSAVDSKERDKRHLIENALIEIVLGKDEKPQKINVAAPSKEAAAN